MLLVVCSYGSVVFRLLGGLGRSGEVIELGRRGLGCWRRDDDEGGGDLLFLIVALMFVLADSGLEGPGCMLPSAL